jgi:hypothetical protein
LIACRKIEFQANLKPLHEASESAGNLQSSRGVGNIEGHNHPFARREGRNRGRGSGHLIEKHEINLIFRIKASGKRLRRKVGAAVSRHPGEHPRE